MCSWPGGCLLWHAELAHVFFGVRRLGDSASKASAPLRHPRHQLQQLECTQLRPGVLTFSPDLHELVLFLVLSAGNSKKTPPSGHSGDHAVLLEFIGGGYGANVAAAWVMPQEDWNAFKDYVRQKPAESISNESLGGRTSDECFDSHYLMSFVQESTDALRVNGFLAAFPDGAFGTEDLFYVLQSLTT
ncbi:NADP-dependent glyceraldehyde-3-phosphate dehydrogenase [Durusdinium trenchii]|uniref:NADP-dependent glyceraldehyde-3-phosphate dehydrogenase n=1 Tax=Durusdinium trenchii TaxID=1381693 RepID=A0ABP0HGT2_9DINO